MELKDFFLQHSKAALAFSGGVDSAYLLWAGRHYGAEIVPYYGKTSFQPRFEYEDAQRLCRELGVGLRTVPVDILAIPLVAANGPRRCYYCKQALFSAIQAQAREDGLSLLLDGTNASDDGADRPGMRALKELEVRSPLRECGLVKEEIRSASREAGLFTWDKPAYACLATRIPTGRGLVSQELALVERAEDFLAGLGLRDFRVRLFAEGARLQVREEQTELVLQRRREILEVLGRDFAAVLLDLEPRRP